MWQYDGNFQNHRQRPYSLSAIVPQMMLNTHSSMKGAAECACLSRAGVVDPAAANKAAAVAAVKSSCLAPFLARELLQGSFKDMASRALYYGTLLWVAHQLCGPELASLVALREPVPGTQVRLHTEC